MTAQVIPLHPEQAAPPVPAPARRRLALYLLGAAILAAPETDAIRKRHFDDTITAYCRALTPTGTPLHFAAAGVWVWVGWHLLVDKRRKADQ